MNKRPRKPSRKALEVAESDPAQAKAVKISVWCTVELVRSDSKKKEYVVNSRYLETESGQPVSEEHLYINSKVIWKSKGKPFDVTILDTHRTKPDPKKKKIVIADSGSSSSDDEDMAMILTPPNSNDTQIDADVYNNNPSVTHFDDEKEISETPKASSRISITKDNSVDFAVPFTRVSQSATPTCTMNTKSIPERLNRIERKIDSMLKLLKNGGYSSSSDSGAKESEAQGKFITESGVDLLSVRGTDASKYALQLMDILFTDQEMASSCYVSSVRSKKPGFDPTRVKLLEDCVKAKFKYDDTSFQTYASQIRRKCTQKCIDKCRVIKKEEDAPKITD